MAELRSRRISVDEATRPVLPRHARLKFDDTRQRWVILAPERVLAPDDIAVEILQLCDGVRNVSDMIDLLVAKYTAPREAIATDVLAMLQDLADKGFPHAGAGANIMSPTLTDASPVLADPVDSLAIMEQTRSTAETFGIPLAVLAELTHRCPLQCPYCSNPVELDRGGTELTTDEWKKVLSELAEIGVLQIHFSGGEPTARKDIVELVQHASDVGLYSNLITSAVLLTREKLAALADAGLCHVQISFQGNEPVVADRVGGYKNGHAKKLEVARWTRELDLPLTVNAVMHRQNLHQLADIIAMAVDLDADRLEVANVQYYGWALKNRAALMPTMAQIEETSAIVDDARVRLKGILDIDYVVPDYYALRPKKCMGGWARQFFNISPAGKVLPCHAAETITGLDFESVRSNHSIAWIWQNSEAFNRYRGTGWMPEPCASCAFKEIDFGGCRCQAFALTGDAGNTDPACTLSPLHAEIFKMAETESSEGSDRFVYRNFNGGTLETEASSLPLPMGETSPRLRG